MILASQKCVFDKRGLGYKTSKNEKYFKNYFVKESTSESSSTICNFCGRGGHISSTCPLRNGSQKASTSKSKKTWVEKSKVTNHLGISKRPGARGLIWARLGPMGFSPAEAQEAQARPKPFKVRAGPRASFQARPGLAG